MANQTVMCTYRVRPDAHDEFMGLLGAHWPTLHDLGAVTDEPARIYRSLAPEDPRLMEIFTWVEGGRKAAEHPDVVAIWERMEQLCEARGDLPAVDFPHFEELALHR